MREKESEKKRKKDRKREKERKGVREKKRKFINYDKKRGWLAFSKISINTGKTFLNDYVSPRSLVQLYIVCIP